MVLVDTAGRLPTQTHLMEELKKIKRVVQKADGTAPHEVLLVIDGNTGQNALAQVKAFDDTLGLTGLIVTKLDGTAKGGVLCAIARENRRFPCTSLAWARSWKTWKPSMPASLPKPCWAAEPANARCLKPVPKRTDAPNEPSLKSGKTRGSNSTQRRIL